MNVEHEKKEKTQKYMEKIVKKIENAWVFLNNNTFLFVYSLG